jgi:hypothetical protein
MYPFFIGWNKKRPQILDEKRFADGFRLRQRGKDA